MRYITHASNLSNLFKQLIFCIILKVASIKVATTASIPTLIDLNFSLTMLEYFAFRFFVSLFDFGAETDASVDEKDVLVVASFST